MKFLSAIVLAMALAGCDSARLGRLEKRIEDVEKQNTELAARVASLSKRSSLDLQEQCAMQVRREAESNKTHFSSVRSHYNEKMNKCFMYTMDIESTRSGSFDTKSVTDAFEGKPYATYLGVIEKQGTSSPRLCRIFGNGEPKDCHSSDEFQ